MIDKEDLIYYPMTKELPSQLLGKYYNQSLNNKKREDRTKSSVFSL